MKKKLAFLLKIFFIFSLLVFIGFVVFAGVLWAGWPWWVCFFIIAGLIGILLWVWLIYKLLLRKKEQQFVSQIIEQDNAAMASRDQKSREISKEMQEKWKQAIAALSKSHLKKKGNPLYVLPWYMIIGKSGSGKTTAIQSADLSSSFAEVGSVSGISGTRNCDWWFFEQAILIDTAGRYAVPVDEGKDRDEWQKFLGLLAKYRKKEPLNGLIVTVSADDLNNSDAESLEQYGRDIRKRVDELMRVLGAKFPVYVMVTKCDLIQGMTQFCDALEKNALDQTMGMINTHHDKDLASVVTDCFKTMGDRIRDIRLLMMQKLKKDRIDPELILFPSELEKINSGLTSFVKGIFQENPYQETPFFRGIFFSSGRQEGTPFSHFLKEMGLIGEKQVLPGTSRGLFLHDFFSRVLPSDRGLFTRTQRGTAWAKLTRNIGLAAWTAVMIALCGVLSFSFVKNLQSIQTASNQMAGPKVFEGDLISDMTTLDRFKDTIIEIEHSNRKWWVPRLGLKESISVEAKLKQKYCILFEDRLLSPFDKQMTESLSYLNQDTQVDAFVRHVNHLVYRINLMKARLLSQNIQNMRFPEFDYIAEVAGTDIAAEVRIKIGELYLNYLTWQEDPQVLNRRMNELQKWLARILAIDGYTLNWLVTRANSDPDLPSYTLADFWGKSAQDESQTMVAAGFTRNGKENIDSFIVEIESALAEPLILAGKKQAFHTWYETAYLDAWLTFISGFENGKSNLKTQQEWQAVSERMRQKKGPYTILMDLIPKELQPFSGQNRMPEWVKLIEDIGTLDKQAAALRAKGGAAGVVGTAVARVKSKIPGVSKLRLDDAELLQAGKAFMVYQDNVTQLAPLVSSQQAAFAFATQIYSNDPGTDTIPFFAAQQAFERLQQIAGYPDEKSAHVWQLLSGPMGFFHEFALKETGCRLQKTWEQEVLLGVQDAGGSKNTNALLMGPDGLVTRFLEGPAAPFVKRGLKQGYYPAKRFDKSVALEPGFFSFLARGVKAARPVKSQYQVKISGLPTSANEDAQIPPHATLLELVCTEGSVLLENLNYPVQRVFNWFPQSECQVIFSIKIGSLTLVKKYTGPYSFPRFLSDFKGGRRSFSPADFPEHQGSLTRLGVKSISVKYEFSGSQEVIGLLGATPGRPPVEIAPCWE
jgi:type VI secretion system protein ImpL